MPQSEAGNEGVATERPRFLIDENLSPECVSGVLRRNPSINIIAIGYPNAPKWGTKDPDVLLFCARDHRALVTNNRKSMPGHLADFAAQGRHHWGIFQIRDGATIGDIIEELLVIWGASEAAEHIDQVEWIPL